MNLNEYTGYTDFDNDIARGKSGEKIFKSDFLEFLDIEYIDVTGCQKFQALDTDFKAKIGTYEIKTNYKDDKQIIIEEYTNIDENLAPVSFGWFYKSGADLFVFISKRTRTMVIVPSTKEFRRRYEEIKQEYLLIRNRISVRGNKRWQSAYRRIPLEAINGFYSMYKKI